MSKVNFINLGIDDHLSLILLAIIEFKLAIGINVSIGNLNIMYPDFTWGKHRRTVEQMSLSKDDEDLGALLLEHSSTYLLTLQMDKALESAISDRFKHPDQEIRSAAWITRLIRNSFAHNPFAPSWMIHPEASDKIFEVKEVMTLKTHNLNHQPVRSGDYGGAMSGKSTESSLT